MKFISLMALLLACPSLVPAQTQDDPTVMTINGQPVSRSEFEYSYNKNNAEGVVDKKTVDEYVDLFVNYKLKVMAALDAKLDTLTSYKREFAQYRDLQVRPAFVTDDDMERQAREIYQSTVQHIGPSGLVKPAHIFIRLGQKASDEEQAQAKARIDSIYKVIKAGADFADIARKHSQDFASAEKGGEMPWISKGQTFKEFEEKAFALNDGELSEPFLSPAGYHIVMMKGHKQLEPYDSLRTDIYSFMEKRNMRNSIAQAHIDSIADASGGKLTKEDVMEQKAEELSANDPELKNLIREYHDGLLLYEMSNRTVWEKAAKDEKGLEAYFKKNKKKYNWTEPRFKGIVVNVR